MKSGSGAEGGQRGSDALGDIGAWAASSILRAVAVATLWER
jgi:hypothetical protein